jgi:TM2 domain-containing membrane protein YozV
MYKEQVSNFKGITPEEYQYVQYIMEGMNEQQAQRFLMYYSGQRKSSDDLLLFTLIGLLGPSGIQRFIMGQIGMGILFFVTLGFCSIGTIIDAINHKSLANEHNQKKAMECANQVKMGM